MDNIEKILEKAKEIIPSTYRIGGICFTSMAVICGKLYSNNPKNLNHVHKDFKYMVSVIITVGKNISGVDTMFYYRMKTSDLGSRANILKHSHEELYLVHLRKFSMKLLFGVDIEP